jgi:hypothetical protein
VDVVEIDPDGAVITEKQAEEEAVINFLNAAEALAEDPEGRDNRLRFMRQVVSDPEGMAIQSGKEMVTKYKGVVERGVKIWKAHTKMKNNPSAAAEPELETIPSGEQTFTFEEFPGYDNFTSSVIRMVYDPKTLVQRVQYRSLCYMHAPVVTQYYSIWNTKLKVNPGATSDHGMIDITAEIATYWKGQDLYRHIFLDEGGVSASFLYRILHANSSLRSLLPEQSSYEDLANALRTYGPALVPAFMVHRDFMDPSIYHHHGLPDTEHPIDGHSMVLVGVRIDDAGKLYYLLQNWWPGKEFVEVSRDYLLASLPSIGSPFQFIKTPQYSVPAERHTHSSRMHWAETVNTIEHPVKLTYK